ncbi:hypothetical protein [Rhizobium sp. BR 362]|uniref:hypothetical protein n=1 Tax=Rhizobium sp. BR 362 TaxID=3040670 RepID=UPI002F40B88D
MAKNRIPKKIAGYRVPKGLRKSAIIKALLASDVGRSILANALTAGAGAAATVLIEDRGQIADAAGTAAGKGKRAISLVSTALSRATDAAMEVVTNSASDALPKKFRKDAKVPPSRGAVH